MTTKPLCREVDLVLRDGSTVDVCPARPSDAPAVRRLLEGLSDRSRWLRFFSACPDLAQAVRWATEVDDGHRYGLVATAEGDGRVVGHAGFEREPDRPERAEVALEVADAVQGKGLGAALLRQLAEAANQVGIQVFDAEVLPDNHKMIRVFLDCGYPVKVHSLPGVQLVELHTSRAVKALPRLESHEQAARNPASRVSVGHLLADHGRDHDAGHHRRAVDVHRSDQEQGNDHGGHGHGAPNGQAPPQRELDHDAAGHAHHQQAWPPPRGQQRPRPVQQHHRGRPRHPSPHQQRHDQRSAQPADRH
jgi:RimJ/RimL family protein N-acetyltransferase